MIVVDVVSQNIQMQGNKLRVVCVPKKQQKTIILHTILVSWLQIIFPYHDLANMSAMYTQRHENTILSSVIAVGYPYILSLS